MVVTFEGLIARNKRNSRLLVLGIILFTIVFCGVLGGGLDGGRSIFLGAALGGVFSIGGAIFSYFGGSSLLVSTLGAKKIEHGDDPELFNVVEEMSIAAGLPMPAVYILPEASLNAFASGRDPEHSLICVTSALREKLTREELQGVIAHEMAHIKNYDIRLMMLVAVFAGMIVLIADAYLRGMRRGSRRSSRGGKDGGAAIFAVIAIVFAILAPVISKLLKLCVSREREYLADATAVQLSRNPFGLISALKKLSSDPDPIEAANRATEHLFIVSPDPKMRLSGGERDSIWSTHPPLGKRVAKLEALLGRVG